MPVGVVDCESLNPILDHEHDAMPASSRRPMIKGTSHDHRPLHQTPQTSAEGYVWTPSDLFTFVCFPSYQHVQLGTR